MEQEFSIKAIINDPTHRDMYTVYLFNAATKVLLPVSTGALGCSALMLAKHNTTEDRPHMHDTFRRVINFFGGTVVAALLYRVVDDTFYTYLRVARDGECYEIDAKFSDAVAIALRVGAPILVAGEVVDASGIKLTRELLEQSLTL